MQLFAGIIFILFILYLFTRLVRIVPEQEAWIVEEFGKFKKTLGPGFHLLVPILQKVAYKQNTKEEIIDVPPQTCVTQDNVQIQVDGVLYLKITDPYKSSYGIDNYHYATAQIAQTTMRSEIGKIELDRTFSERESINNAVVKAVDEASDPWGIKVTRYEIKDLVPPRSVLEAMESQMRAEREKRAEILESEGDRESRVNFSIGEKEESINISKGERQRRINEAEGKAKAIAITSNATAQGIKMIAQAINKPGGKTAMSMQLAEQYIKQVGEILHSSDTSVLPMEAAQLKGLIGSILPGLNLKGGNK
ncbi:SPFH domain-containing protein [Spirochaeta cellobiosiphila]|uniref:SPFH domain-containing protein n=1 Tax=Spirochaeta cellobiosiphila TaxID=504483 RepID=UPI0003F5B3F4|nr:slipin family protein [Spirochaeta cellobiosiphila]